MGFAFYLVLALLMIILIDIMAISLYDDHLKRKYKERRKNSMMGTEGNPYVVAIVVVIVCLVLMCCAGFIGVKKYLDALAEAANLMP